MDKNMKSSDKESVKFNTGISRGGIETGDGDDSRSCPGSGNLSKNLPMRPHVRKISEIAQNSVAQNKKYDLPCQNHQQTELREERKRPFVQRNLPRNSDQRRSKRMTRMPSQKRFSIVGNSQKNHEQQNHSSHRTIPSDILFNLTPLPQSPSSIDTTMMKEHHDMVPNMEPEVDTRDTMSSGTRALHRMLEVESQSAVEEHLAQIAVVERRLVTAVSPTSKRRKASFQHGSQLPIQSHDSIASPSSIESSPPRSHRTTPSSTKRTSSRNHKKLTLSAYRKPEETVRLTECDVSRLLENEYNLRAPGCKVIGHGAFSTVRSALRITDGTKVAIKSISKFDALRARRLRRPKGSKHMDEWEIMKLLRHNPHVLSLYDVFETEDEIHLVTEFCRGGELFHAIKRKSLQRSSFRRGRFSEYQSAQITKQILKALVELHALGIVHRDIKAENILILNNDDSDIKVKLCDFGMARLHQRCQQTSISEISSDGEASPSTPALLFGYSVNAPPEGCRGSCIGPATDIFSLGATLYILLCGYPPVFCENVVEFPEAYWDDISDEAKDIVRSMLHHDPKQRISSKDALKNLWIQKESIRVKRSISANLELVRACLKRSLGDTTGRSSSLLTSRTTNGSGKRRGFVHTDNSPSKRSRISSLDISLGALYGCSDKHDVRVIEERVESRSMSGEERSEGMAC